MGLDMYLKRSTYVKNWDHNDYKHEVSVTINGEKHPYINLENVTSVVEEIGYWRKANAIHRWFVDNCQGGVDDCRLSYVTMEQLKELYDTCMEIQADHSKAEDLLPTQSGFFFGNTEYSEMYFEDIENTIKILKPHIEFFEEIKSKIEKKERVIDFPDFYYESSW